MQNRLCVYVVYDKDGIVDDYIPYFLNALKPFVSHMVIVCNGKLDKAGRDKLSLFTSDLFVRENKGYDAGAIKDVLCNLYGWEKVLRFDELLIANDTFYAPIHPLDECFGKMDSMNVDFWGLLESKAFGNLGVVFPPHLQSYFLNVKRNLLRAPDFKAFFESIDVVNFGEAVMNYEIRFTREFVEKGYKYCAYIEDVDWTKGDPALQGAAYIADKYRMPVLKRKAFYFHDDDAKYGFDYAERKERLFEIAQSYGYNPQLIRQNLAHIERTVKKRKPVTAIADLFEFCERYDVIYIYGAGLYAEVAAVLLDKQGISYSGFIVSDDQPKRDTFHSHQCIYLSELQYNEHVGIILGLDIRNRAQVEPLLSKHGINNIISV